MKRLAFIAMLLFAQNAIAGAFPPTIPVTVTTAKGPVVLNVEVVATPESREVGLMNRNTLKPADGMLFLFPKIDDVPFWMKNTRVPLDIMYISEQHRIQHIAHGEPLSLTPLPSNGNYESVIEIDGGRAKREGIKEGDKVNYTIPNQWNLHVE